MKAFGFSLTLSNLEHALWLKESRGLLKRMGRWLKN